MPSMVGIYPETAREALKRWDAGEPVFTLSMGGLGPGYEQAIHVAAFELIRDEMDKPLPDIKLMKAEGVTWGGETLARITDWPHMGLSGAQWYAATFLAYRSLRDGWREVLEKHGPDRVIQVSRSWPRSPHA